MWNSVRGGPELYEASAAWRRRRWHVSEQTQGSARADTEYTLKEMCTATERDDTGGLAPATAAIWTGLSDFINRDEAAALLEQGFCLILSSCPFFLGHLGKTTTLKGLLEVKTDHSNFGENFKFN